MLTYSELVTLEHSLREARVLSVYLDGSARDPAIQGAWRLQLDHALDAARDRAAHGTRDERERFDAAERRLLEYLVDRSPSFGAAGWAAFVTPERIVHASDVDGALPTLAIWRTGACVAPYIAAVEQLPSAIIAIVDARRGTMYTVKQGVLDHGEAFHSFHTVEPAAHMGDVARTGFHGGTRGSTGRDAAQRALREGTMRMLRQMTERISAAAGSTEAVIIGGIPRIVAHLAPMLEPLGDRLTTARSLDVHATPAQILSAARRAARSVRERRVGAEIEDLVDQADASGLGAVGEKATVAALKTGAVRKLYVSARYAANHLKRTDQNVRAALDEDAVVEIATGGAGAALDERGGIGARLRFHPGEVTLRAAETEAAPA